ncbi:MAG TPA: hypothetical protein VOB72_26840 [Candidatus Dormibacteraeota bacterium]|nr:hypothetical protein [Candidatus Dormibacteraeota bacterium]
MHRLVAILLAAVVLAACGQGVWLSRQDAINRTQSAKGLSAVNRREAKLMTWPDFLRVSQVQANPQDAPPGKQRVWLVAVAGNIELGPQGAHEKWAIFVYNAVTGSEIGHIVGPYDQMTGEAVGEDWPPNWSSFPDAG